MKKGIYFLLFALVVSYSACKKKETTPAGAVSAILNSVSQIPGGESTTYSYDTQGRLEKMQNSVGSSTTISYSGDTVIESNYNDSGTLVSFNVLFLNPVGLAITSYLSDTSGNILSHSNYSYDTANIKTSERTYDAVNNLVAHKEWSILDNNVYYYTISDSLTVQNNAEFGYSYSYEKENTTGNDNMGLKYYGKSSKNIMKSMTKTSNATGNTYYTYQYTFDGSGRVATQTAYNHQGQLIHTNTYTYN